MTTTTHPDDTEPASMQDRARTARHLDLDDPAPRRIHDQGLDPDLASSGFRDRAFELLGEVRESQG